MKATARFISPVLVLELISACGLQAADNTPTEVPDEVDAGSGGGNSIDQPPGLDTPDAPNTPPQPEATCDSDCTSWCDPQTWGGNVPDKTTAVVIPSGKSILLDCVANAKSVVIEQGGTLKASRTDNTTLTVWGNFVVRGRLDYGTPESRITSQAEIIFAGLNNMDVNGSVQYVEYFSTPPTINVLNSDVGLWVVDSGLVTAAGRPKRSWSFLSQTVSGNTLNVSNATGWEIGDNVMLTPTTTRDVPGFAEQFDMGTITSVNGNEVELSGQLEFEHLGCTDCMRRGEAGNITRNVVIRAQDAANRAHITVTDSGSLQLDSTELRWLGPEKNDPSNAICDTPDGRPAVFFVSLAPSALPSYLKHVSIWDSRNSALHALYADNVEITDVVAFDISSNGFYFPRIMGDSNDNVVMTDVLTANVTAVLRVGSGKCERQFSGGWGGIAFPGGENSGCRRCVATGVRGGSDASGFASQFMSPTFFEDSIAHNNGGLGLYNWTSMGDDTTYEGLRIWSNGNGGVVWGPYVNSGNWHDATIVDSGTSFRVRSVIAEGNAPTFSDMVLDSIGAVEYTLPTQGPHHFVHTTFTGVDDVGFSQIHDVCDNPEDENNPNAEKCSRVHFVIENAVFTSNMNPFDFGWAANAHSRWEVRGFSHPNATYAALPENFDLVRRKGLGDFSCSEGSYHSQFGACLLAK